MLGAQRCFCTLVDHYTAYSVDIQSLSLRIPDSSTDHTKTGQKGLECTRHICTNPQLSSAALRTASSPLASPGAKAVVPEWPHARRSILENPASLRLCTDLSFSLAAPCLSYSANSSSLLDELESGTLYLAILSGMGVWLCYFIIYYQIFVKAFVAMFS